MLTSCRFIHPSDSLWVFFSKFCLSSQPLLLASLNFPEVKDNCAPIISSDFVFSESLYAKYFALHSVEHGDHLQENVKWASFYYYCHSSQG